MSTKLIAAVVGCAVLATGSMRDAQAFEGSVSPYPAGAVGTNIANLPPLPGVPPRAVPRAAPHLTGTA